jgi:hypothetical protein
MYYSKIQFAQLVLILGRTIQCSFELETTNLYESFLVPTKQITQCKAYIFENKKVL